MAVEVLRRGEGHPLVLIHPLGADRNVWAPVLEALAAHHEVHAVDLPGFGASAPLAGPEPPTPARLAAAVAERCEQLGLERPAVAGCSLGGWVALELARSGMVSSVTTLCSAGLWPQPLAPRRGVARTVARLLSPVAPALVTGRTGRRLALAGTVAHPERVPAQVAVALLRAYARAPGFDAVNRAMRAGHFEGWGDIDVPVTLAWGELDRLVGPPRQVPQSVRSVLIEDCGHLAMWDRPDVVTQLILETAQAGQHLATHPR